MRKLLSSLILYTAVIMPNCATFVANNPGYTRALENYNCRKGYSACRQHVVVEVVHVYQD